MIYHEKDKRLYLIPADLLLFSSLAYLLSGVVYGYLTFSEVHLEATYSLLACVLSWIFVSIKFKDRGCLMQVNITKKTEIYLISLAYVGVFIFIAFLLYAGGEYLSGDKIQRSSIIHSVFFVRVPLYASFLLMFILYSDINKRFKFLKDLLFLALIIISLIEINREMLVILSLLYILRHYYYYKNLLIPKGLIGFIFLILIFGFFLLFIKPLLYYVVLGYEYDGGYFNFGETVNWYRWLNYAHVNSIDISNVQRNDMQYTLSSFIFPFSTVDSSSKIWFTEILGNSDLGRTFGYSGVLWLSNYFYGIFIFIPWFLLFILYSIKLNISQGLRILFFASLAIISFRFFRSEWPLVLKTFLWLLFYPSALFYLISRCRWKSD